MRKLLLSVASILLMAGLVVAAEYSVVSYDAATKTLTLKDGDKEVKAKLTDTTKVFYVDKEGNKKEGKVGGLEKAWEKKAPKKIDATVSGGNVTEVTVKRGGKKKKDN
jgi:hypothetical protein